MFKSTWKCHAVFIINHGGSHWCTELPPKELLLPRTCVLLNIVSPIKGGKIPLDYSHSSYAGHWTSRNHSRLYLSLLWVFSKPENHPGCVSHSHVHPMTSLMQKWCHLVVGHTLKYTVSKKWSKSDWRFQRYRHFCITPLLKISPILTITS